MKQNFIRTCALLLSALTILPILSCASETPTDTETTTAAQTQAVTEVPAAEVKYEPDDLPDDLDYEGQTVHMFCRTTDVPEFTVEEENGDIVNDAVFQRNLKVEERLNIDLTFTQIDGGNYDRATWVKTVTGSTMAGDGANDIIAGYSMCLPVLSMDGLLLNLRDYEYLNFSKPWWPASLIDEVTCGDKLFFCSGDISTYMIYYLYATYFNKSFVADYDLEDPYELVRQGKWTLDKLFEISAQLYSDVNGDGIKGSEDQFGYLTNDVYADSLFFAAGLTTTEKDADGIPYISSQFGGEKTQALVTRLVDAFKTNPGMMLVYSGSDGIFMESRAMFYTTEVYFAATSMRDTEIEYGILPVPKYDEAQENYCTVSGFPYNLFGIPVDAKDPEMSSAVMECLASESYRTVSPALFETALKVKYASDSDGAEMYDLIRASNFFDFGRVFNDCMNGLTYTLFRDAVYKGQTTWISTFEKRSKTLNRLLTKVTDALLEQE